MPDSVIDVAMEMINLKHPAPGGVVHTIIISPHDNTAKLVHDPTLGLRLVHDSRDFGPYVSYQLDGVQEPEKGSAAWHIFNGLRALAAPILTRKHVWELVGCGGEFFAVQRDTDGSRLFNLLVAGRAPLSEAMYPPPNPFDLEGVLDEAERLETKARVYGVVKPSAAAREARRIADYAWDYAAFNEELESHKWRYLAPGAMINHGRAGKRRVIVGSRLSKVTKPCRA